MSHYRGMAQLVLKNRSLIKQARKHCQFPAFNGGPLNLDGSMLTKRRLPKSCKHFLGNRLLGQPSFGATVFWVNHLLSKTQKTVDPKNGYYSYLQLGDRLLADRLLSNPLLSKTNYIPKRQSAIAIYPKALTGRLLVDRLLGNRLLSKTNYIQCKDIADRLLGKNRGQPKLIT